MYIEELTLADQIDDNNKKAKKNKLVTPHPDKDNPQNGIPMLVSSDGLNEPAIDPNIMSQGNDYASTTAELASNGSIGESLLEDTSEEQITLDIMKNNINYCRIHANDIFKNLMLQCDWDSSSSLINILVQFKPSAQEDYVKNDSLYPYPLDITIPNDLDPIIIYNSKKSVDAPDMSTEVAEPDSPFSTSNWGKLNEDDALAMVLRSQLEGLDNALDTFNESLLESDSISSDYELVDSKEVPNKDGNPVDYEWYMDEDQNSVFFFDDSIDYESDDIEDAQSWWDTYAGFPDEDMEGYITEDDSSPNFFEIDKDGNISYKGGRHVFTSTNPNRDNQSIIKSFNGVYKHSVGNAWKFFKNNTKEITKNECSYEDDPDFYYYNETLDTANLYGLQGDGQGSQDTAYNQGDYVGSNYGDNALDHYATQPIDTSESYAVIKTTAPYGADEIADITRTKSVADDKARELNSQVDSNEVKYIARKITPDNKEKYDLNKLANKDESMIEDSRDSYLVTGPNGEVLTDSNEYLSFDNAQELAITISKFSRYKDQEIKVIDKNKDTVVDYMNGSQVGDNELTNTGKIKVEEGSRSMKVVDEALEAGWNESLLEGSLALGDRGFMDTPVSHFKDLAKKDGYKDVIARLTQLANWNVNKNPSITKRARDIVASLKKDRG